jgi:hypothetical protein
MIFTPVFPGLPDSVVSSDAAGTDPFSAAVLISDLTTWLPRPGGHGRHPGQALASRPLPFGNPVPATPFQLGGFFVVLRHAGQIPILTKTCWVNARPSLHLPALFV